MVDESAYSRLAAAIVGQACDDYLWAKRVLISKDAGPRKRYNAQCLLDDCKHFFASSWCGELADIDPDVLVAKLDAMVYSGKAARRDP